jgi:hypothetical protein
VACKSADEPSVSGFEKAWTSGVVTEDWKAAMCSDYKQYGAGSPFSQLKENFPHLTVDEMVQTLRTHC